VLVIVRRDRGRGRGRTYQPVLENRTESTPSNTSFTRPEEGDVPTSTIARKSRCLLRRSGGPKVHGRPSPGQWRARTTSPTSKHIHFVTVRTFFSKIVLASITFLGSSPSSSLPSKSLLPPPLLLLPQRPSLDPLPDRASSHHISPNLPT
jgi:hypothetical protein